MISNTVRRSVKYPARYYIRGASKFDVRSITSSGLVDLATSLVGGDADPTRALRCLVSLDNRLTYMYI